jgi:hypothetical protein
MTSDVVGRITTLSENRSVRRLLNLEESDSKINGSVSVDVLRGWWKESNLVGNVSKKFYRSLDEFEEFLQKLEGLE